jgi:fermentation-respiration switch protein FrsA (DUF1100 family)
MIDISQIDFSTLDCPEVLRLLFHPRPESSVSSFVADRSISEKAMIKDAMIPVDENVTIGSRFHMTEKFGGNILFFHGNGEIVADYDDLGPIYNQMGINFLAVDYRGYGRSGGEPTVTAMMRDCHVIFNFVRKWLLKNDFWGPIVPMGRSLGSASVLEIAANYQDLIGGIIVESGFAYAGPLLKLLGINLERLGFKEDKSFRNVDKIRHFHQPTLIIHAENDHIIPFSDGQALYEACSAANKIFLSIPGANHNDIFMRGMQAYLAAVKNLVTSILSK